MPPPMPPMMPVAVSRAIASMLAPYGGQLLSFTMVVATPDGGQATLSHICPRSIELLPASYPVAEPAAPVSPPPAPPPTSCPAPERRARDVSDRPQARLVLVTLGKAGKALTADALAYLCGKREGADGGFRGLLARMRRRNPPLLRRTAEGYALAEAGRAIADGEASEAAG